VSDLVSALRAVKSTLPKNVSLIAVSKTKPMENIVALHEAGQLAFGENKVQELVDKYEALPKDIEWHMIGHLQRNKVKYIAPFVHLIHGVDSARLFAEIEKQGKKSERTIAVLLQVHIAEESSKFGFDEDELTAFLSSEAFLKAENIRVCGLMGMATFTDDLAQVQREFEGLANMHQSIKSNHFNTSNDFNILSMGMSGDYAIAIEAGSTMVRVGSAIFGAR